MSACTGALQGLHHVLHDLDEVPPLQPTCRRRIPYRISCNHVLIDGRTAFHRLDIGIDPAERVDGSKCLAERRGGYRECPVPHRFLLSPRHPAGENRTDFERVLKIASNAPTRVQDVGFRQTPTCWSIGRACWTTCLTAMVGLRAREVRLGELTRSHSGARGYLILRRRGG